MKHFLLGLGFVVCGTSTLMGQESMQFVQAVEASPRPDAFLPAGTEIALKMTETVTTKGNGWAEGDQFNLSVASNVMLGDYVVIARGTKARGRITWLTSRGAFGKSGKMDVELEYLEMRGRRINLDGTYRQEGDGATLATVGGVVLAGVFAGFITGKSGIIPQGRELMATLESDLPVDLPGTVNAASAATEVTASTSTAVAPAPVVAVPVGGAAKQSAKPLERDAGLKPRSAAKCITCR